MNLLLDSYCEDSHGIFEKNYSLFSCVQHCWTAFSMDRLVIAMIGITEMFSPFWQQYNVGYRD